MLLPLALQHQFVEQQEGQNQEGYWSMRFLDMLTPVVLKVNQLELLLLGQDNNIDPIDYCFDREW